MLGHKLNELHPCVSVHSVSNLISTCSIDFVLQMFNFPHRSMNEEVFTIGIGDGACVLALLQPALASPVAMYSDAPSKRLLSHAKRRLIIALLIGVHVCYWRRRHGHRPNASPPCSVPQTLPVCAHRLRSPPLSDWMLEHWEADRRWCHRHDRRG